MGRFSGRKVDSRKTIEAVFRIRRMKPCSNSRMLQLRHHISPSKIFELGG
jgi:hypothetical protein